MGEDQDPAGARGLDEADGGDRLAGAGGVLEPEAAVGARILRGLLDDVLVLLLVPVLGLLLLGGLLLFFFLLDGLLLGVGARAVLGGASSFVAAGGGLPFPLPAQGWPLSRSWTSAISAASVPESASTWCGSSSAPSARCGFSSESSRSRPSMSEKSRRHSIDGASRPSSISTSAASRALRRGVPGCEVLGLLALEQERLASELAGSLDIGARRRLCRFGGRLGVFSHLRLFDPPLLATGMMARRNWPDHGGHPRCGSPLRALPGSRNLMDRLELKHSSPTTRMP